MAGVVLCTAACGSSGVSVDSFEMTDAGKRDCRSIIDALPKRVADLDARQVEGSSYAAAWGTTDDPIVLRCGVPMPADFTQTSECNVANGIGWYAAPTEADDQGSDVTLTTVHREPAVSITVPASLRPPVTAMVDLAPVLKEHTKSLGDCR